MSRFDEKPGAPKSPLNSFLSSDRYVGQGLATYGGLDHAILDQHATIEDVDNDVDAVAEVASDDDTLFAVGRSHWGVDNPNLADEVATSSPVMDRVSVSEVAMDAVSVSEVAMDAVSVSDIALDAIWASTIAWDAVKTKSMAVGKFAVGRVGLDGADYADVDAVAASQTAMDAVSTSQTAMDAVSTSATGMEAVAASQTAMDAVVAATDVALPTVVETVTAMNEVSLSDLALDTLWASTAAWDLIKTNAMSVGKFAAGRAGLSGYDYADIDAVAGSQTAMDSVSTSSTAMDAVSTSSTAMDAVAGSQTAMDAVAASIDARSAVFESDYSIDSLWASTPGAKTVLATSGNRALPYSTSTPGGDASITVDDGTASALPGTTAHQLYLDINGADDGNYVSITYTLDLGNSSTLEIKDKAEGGVNDSRFKHGVKIDGTSVFSTGGLNGYTTRSLDVSSYSGTHDVEFYHDNTGYNNTGENHEFYFADFNLI